MITRIRVDGFKSLKEFELDFSTGLNLLVGPNGSGKTNIVSFFEFLAHLMESDASEATSSVGGAGAVFRRINHTYERRMKVEIAGCVQTDLPGRPRKNPGREGMPFWHYDYSFVLNFPEDGDSILFEKQRLKLSRCKGFGEVKNFEAEIEWEVDIEVCTNSDGSSGINALVLNEDILDVPYAPASTSRKNLKAQKDTLERILGQMLNGGSLSLLPALGRFSRSAWVLVSDLKGGQIYNIVPSELKIPEDSSKAPGITKDGSGLAATLYALQRSKGPPDYGPWLHRASPRRRYDPTALDKLKEYLSLVNPSVADIRVDNDQFENQLRVRFEVKSGDYTATLPMALMSDGTLKWLAVVTAAVTTNSVFCIEEPENYLHPKMQGQIVTILREILFQPNTMRFTLMTTHSETLLNRCKPEELIIVSMEGGRTIAKRPTNADEISDEINRTGFGLGYYYISDAISDE